MCIAYTIVVLLSLYYISSLPMLATATLSLHFYAVDLVNQTNVLIWLRNGILFISAFIVHLLQAEKSINDIQWVRENGREEKMIFAQMRVSKKKQQQQQQTCTHCIAIKNTHTYPHSFIRWFRSFIHASGYTSEINILFVAINSFLLL